ncbi:DUF948 domain-containing protein [Rossellomorea vietnamensis]|uniref:DUF948 domain-containing protein n=1 Tax=Rossellomorea vietnamensis TaxID=218284 RepID=A0ACD4C6R9_9BACI|nr:DUF948 domain-containing protein [Rossellomorea vietnamensis]UXH43287.1 DUF948 domain-containing protein [Rossellomorea vietnamensis]
MLEWSAVIAAVAFTILVVYLIMTLRKVMTTLAETEKTLSDTRNAVNGITGEAEELIHTANQISDDVKGKMKAVDPLIESVHDVGDMLHNVTSSVKRTALQKSPPKTIHAQERDSIQIKLK